MKAITTIFVVLIAFGNNFLVFGESAGPKDGNKELTPLFFDVKDTSSDYIDAPKIQPWKEIRLAAGYSGEWVVTGDIDNDNEIEIVSAMNVTYKHSLLDNHYTSAVCAQNLDGSILWQWGNAQIGRKKLNHDVACQIYDWNSDGKSEVVVAGKEYLYELDGKTGHVLRKIKLPNEAATDCIIFCNLTGNKNRADVLLKDRYEQIWAISSAGDLLWTTKLPGGCWVGHYPHPIDIDGDNKDEIFCGFVMLNSDGTLRWKLTGTAADLKPYGHMDSQVVFKKGTVPEEWLFALTFCGSNNIALIDGLGRVQKETGGFHFESVDLGRVFPTIDSPQLLVDVDHAPKGSSPVVIFDSNLNVLGRITLDYSRIHALVDWDGDGYDDIVIGDSKGIYNYKGEKIGVLDMRESGRGLQIADIDGDGVKDIVLVASNAEKVYLFKNTKGCLKTKNIKLGTKANFTLY